MVLVTFCVVLCVLFAVSLQTTTLAASPSQAKAKRVTLTDGMTMPLTGVCVFVLKVVPNNRAVNLSSIEDVSTCVCRECTYGSVLVCHVRLLSMGRGACVRMQCEYICDYTYVYCV